MTRVTPVRHDPASTDSDRYTDEQVYNISIALIVKHMWPLQKVRHTTSLLHRNVLDIDSVLSEIDILRDRRGETLDKRTKLDNLHETILRQRATRMALSRAPASPELRRQEQFIEKEIAACLKVLQE